jgi:hypothetical protein
MIHKLPWEALQRIDGQRGGRYYVGPEGQRLDSVTNLLSVINKPALIPWAAKVERELVIEAAANLYLDAPTTTKMTRDAFVRTLGQRIGAEKAHQRIAKKATDIGGQAHALIEWNIRKELGQKPGAEPKVDRNAGTAFAAFASWWKGAGYKPVRVEQMIFHPGKLYAGTLDLLATDAKDRLGIVDFKTSKAIYPEYLLQVSAYAEAVNAMGHGPVEWAVIARFPKGELEPPFNPERDIHEVTLTPELFETFCNAQVLHQWLESMNKAAPLAPATENGSSAAGEGHKDAASRHGRRPAAREVA